MNYYFFLDFSDIGLDSSIDVFNTPSISMLYNKPLRDKNIIIFYSEEGNWKHINYGLLKKNCHISIKKSDLPKNLKNKSVFLYLSDIDSNFDINYKSNYTNAVPEWRSNIRILNKNTSCSYQGELPSIMKNKKISLISCSPMIQNNPAHESYFILVNLTNDPIIKKFEVQILDSKKNIIDSSTFYTNTINKYKLNHFNYKLYNTMLIFKSTQQGGIPLYFTRSMDNTSMSLEHTHPPQAYFIFGNTLNYQKRKKIFWS